jgi:hypothetical protein
MSSATPTIWERLGWHHRHPTGLIIREINNLHRYFDQEGREIMSTPAGGTSTFQEVPTPAGSVFPAGTTFTWSVDDTADISLVPSTDGTQVTATCVATPAATSYNLTCQSSYVPPGATTGISATLNVAIVPAAPALPTAMIINQLS